MPFSGYERLFEHPHLFAERGYDGARAGKIGTSISDRQVMGGAKTFHIGNGVSVFAV